MHQYWKLFLKIVLFIQFNFFVHIKQHSPVFHFQDIPFFTHLNHLFLEMTNFDEKCWSRMILILTLVLSIFESLSSISAPYYFWVLKNLKAKALVLYVRKQRARSEDSEPHHNMSREAWPHSANSIYFWC